MADLYPLKEKFDVCVCCIIENQLVGPNIRGLANGRVYGSAVQATLSFLTPVGKSYLQIVSNPQTDK